MGIRRKAKAKGAATGKLRKKAKEDCPQEGPHQKIGEGKGGRIRKKAKSKGTARKKGKASRRTGGSERSRSSHENAQAFPTEAQPSSVDAEVPAAVATEAEVACPPDKRRLVGGLYGAGDVILLVGEGDFSFACALMQKLKGSAFIVATVMDTQKMVKRKHPDAYDNAKRLVSAGMVVRYGVDCRHLHRVVDYRAAFTKIVFNFPHLGGDDTDVEGHQALLREFFASAAECLEPSAESEVHVTLRNGEPYRSWQIERMAKSADGGALTCNRVVPFKVQCYPGYQHRRTRGDSYAASRGLEDRNVLSAARTYVFRLRKMAIEAATVIDG